VTLPLLLFTHEPKYGAAAIDAGVAGIVVDWEARGKAARQGGVDTEVNLGTAEDLAAMRSVVAGHLVCRINNEPGTRRADLRLACDLGANEVWLPMVRRVDEVEDCLGGLPAGVALGVLAETREALRMGRALGELPLARVFVGLNDYRIDRGHRGLFDPLVDGTLERFRDEFGGALGFAGVTDPERGRPLPQRLLLAEMARMRCAFGVARRSFRADTPQAALAATVRRIDREYAALLARDGNATQRDRLQLLQALAWPAERSPHPGPPPSGTRGRSA
jgi:hypothetical protein